MTISQGIAGEAILSSLIEAGNGVVAGLLLHDAERDNSNHIGSATFGQVQGVADLYSVVIPDDPTGFKADVDGYRKASDRLELREFQWRMGNALIRIAANDILRMRRHRRLENLQRNLTQEQEERIADLLSAAATRIADIVLIGPQFLSLARRYEEKMDPETAAHDAMQAIAHDIIPKGYPYILICASIHHALLRDMRDRGRFNSMHATIIHILNQFNLPSADRDFETSATLFEPIGLEAISHQWLVGFRTLWETERQDDDQSPPAPFLLS